MKNISKYPLLCLMAIFSCACQEEMVEDIDIKPQFSGETIEVSALVAVGETKAYMGEKTEKGYPFLWNKQGESLLLLERARLEGSDIFTPTQNAVSSSDYSLSENGKSANFSFELQGLTNGYDLEYACLSPASCFVKAEESGILVEVPVVQTSSMSAPDPKACLLWDKAKGFSAQPTSLTYAKEFKHPLAYVTFNVKNLALLPGEKVTAVSLTFEDKEVTGELEIKWNGDCAATQNSHSYVNIKKEVLGATDAFSVCFATIPFEMNEEEKIVVNVQTSLSVYSRTIEVSGKMSFPAGEMTSFGADMQNAERQLQTAVKMSSGVEYNLNETSAGVYETEIPYSGVGSLTFMFAGVEYGQLEASGSGMVGTHPSGVHVSKTIGRLAVGGQPIQMKTSKAETVLVRLDISNEDAIPRYYLELPETEKDVYLHEDFSLMTWGGDYYTYADGVSPDMTADAVDGTEAASKKTTYTQSSFGNKTFDNTNVEYLKNRGLADWTFEYCCERPFAIQVGHANGAGSITTPALSSLTNSTTVNLLVDMARFGGDSKNVKISFEILGEGQFDVKQCSGSRDAYTCNYGSYNAILDVMLSDNEFVFSEDGKTVYTISNGQGKLIPRVYNNDATFKPHTKLNFRIKGVDSNTKFRISGESTTARFTIFDIKVIQGEGYMINGTVIDETSTLYGLAREASTGKPIVGLPVTDGYTYTTTDANGVYQMTGNEKARCIYPSIPAEYEIPLATDGQPQIYQYIKGETSRYDFTLTPRTTSWEDFTIMAITDVHFYSKGGTQTDEENKFKTHHVPDITNYLSSASASGEISKNVIAVSLGDNTSNYTEKLSHIRQNLYSLIKMDGKTLPMFHAIGNHDHRGDAMTDYEAVIDFVNVFGPTDYSINIGNAHIVFMDNTMCVEEEQPHDYGKAMSFVRGVTDQQWAWLQADLANVKNKGNKLLIMCMHAPIFASTYSNFANIRTLMKTFAESHIMTGHLHKEIIRDFTTTWNGTSGRLSQEHNLVALGANWTGGWAERISVDGTPMGYNIFNVSGDKITESFFNPVGQEDDYQFRIYNGGDKYEDDKTVTYEGEDPVTYKFDWNSMFRSKYGDDSMDMSGKFVVKVFAAGTRKQFWDVYLVDAGGNRTKMQWHEKEIADVCTSAYFYVKKKRTSKDYAGTSSKNVWTVDVPQQYLSDPEKAFSEGGYKVVAEYKSPGGKVFTYESNTVQSTKTTSVGGIFDVPYEYYYNGFGY